MAHGFRPWSYGSKVEMAWGREWTKKTPQLVTTKKERRGSWEGCILRSHLQWSPSSDQTPHPDSTLSYWTRQYMSPLMNIAPLWSITFHTEGNFGGYVDGNLNSVAVFFLLGPLWLGGTIWEVLASEPWKVTVHFQVTIYDCPRAEPSELPVTLLQKWQHSGAVLESEIVEKVPRWPLGEITNYESGMSLCG